MTGFKSLIGQQRPARILCNALINGRIPHALLFTGEDGVGKRTAAIELAGICNCSESSVTRPGAGEPEQSPAACGKCRSCRKIRSGTHPEVHVIKPSGANIRIDQVRSLYQSIALKPDEASKRFVIIADAHLMNREAGNALLKVLEEPPEATFFILTAPDTQDLLPTIVSRCRHIRFNPIPQKDLEKYLADHCALETDHAMIIASLARGSLARAIEMSSEDWISRRNFIINKLEQLPRQSGAFRHAFAELLAADRDKIETIFEIMKNWYRDLAVFFHSPEKVYNRDLHEQIRSALRQTCLSRILEKADAVSRAEKVLGSNANIRLALDALVDELAE
ncbi:MAG: DNA polymerase III subunit delta' [Desulfobacterales bacterium]|nr:DNA polymerase III subunit delta' [Desulfobacterales bacterium]